ncbi:MAG TPA: glyoxalase superfamily protein [Acidimicrobiales bacterium]|nr:glyoxalase superfamily protein [Acidimicrobiales bacterium]
MTVSSSRAAPSTVSGEQAIPVLRVRDAGTSVAWYRRLGFEPEWEHRFGPGFPTFVSIARGQVRLFLSEHLGDTVPRSVVYLRLSGLEALAAELDTVPEETDWQTRELTLHDPDGNRVRVGVLANPAP